MQLLLTCEEIAREVVGRSHAVMVRLFDLVGRLPRSVGRGWGGGSLGRRAGGPPVVAGCGGVRGGTGGGWERDTGRMCRSIKTLRPPAIPEEATEDEVRAAALQYVRKVSGFRAPAAHNREVFDAAVDAVAAATADLLAGLEVRGAGSLRALPRGCEFFVSGVTRPRAGHRASGSPVRAGRPWVRGRLRISDSPRPVGQLAAGVLAAGAGRRTT